MEPFPGLGACPDRPQVPGSSYPAGLRPWRPADAPALVDAWSDPDIAAWCEVPADAGLARAEAWIAGWEERRRAGTALDLVIERDGAVAGEVGLAPFRGTVADVVELGWWVLPAHRGAGLASTMVSAVVGWAGEALAGRRIVARIPPGHTASERVAAAAGLVRAGPLDDSHDLWKASGTAVPR
jgi:RimJ/RimL family protein N-acetyltransferase